MAGIQAEIEAFAAAHSGLIALGSLLVAMIAAFPAILALRQRRGHSDMTLLLDHRTWPTLLAGLNPSPAKAYLSAISKTNAAFDRIYGEKLLGWHALGRAHFFAVGYSFVTLTMGWLLFDAGHLGGAIFLPEGLSPVSRVAIAVTIGLAAILSFRTTSKFQDKYLMSAKIYGSREVKLAETSDFPTRVYWKCWFRFKSPAPYVLFVSSYVVIVAGTCLLAGLIARVSAIKVAVIGSVAGMFVGFMAFPIILRRGPQFFGVIASSTTGLLVLLSLTTLVPTGDEKIDFFFSFALFLMLLPLLNALADFLSVAATRHFLRKIAAQGRVRSVIFGTMIDLGIALICLAALLWSITFALDLWALVALLPFDWRAYRAEICAGGWTRGTMLWLMLATTLLPTALHLAAGLTGLMLRKPQIDRQIETILRPAHDALIAAKGAEIFQTHQPELGETALTRAQQHEIDLLFGWRSMGATLTFWVVVVLAMLAMGLLALGVAQSLFPVACPA